MAVDLDSISPTIVLQNRYSNLTSPTSAIGHIINHFRLLTVEDHLIGFDSFDRPLHR